MPTKAREVGREILKKHGVVIVIIEDEDGERVRHAIYVLNTDKCEKCGRQHPGAGGAVDLEATVAGLLAQTDGRVAKWKAAVMSMPAPPPPKTP